MKQEQKTVVVIGNGMVGHRFCERLVEFDTERVFKIITFCEEPRPAYDRVHLTKYFDHRKAKKAAVIGGGLLGLEAAKASYDLGLETHVVEFASRLMPRQIDDTGSRVLVGKINALGVRVHLNKNTKEILGNGKVEGMAFADGAGLDVGMVVVSAGIKPRDDLARSCGLTVGQRGGVAVDEQLRTSDPNIFAIGEVALFGGTIFGLASPGYEMADTLAANLCGQTRAFRGADMSTKLKLMGVDVASFGNWFADEATAKAITFHDPFKGIYKKLLF